MIGGACTGDIGGGAPLDPDAEQAAQAIPNGARRLTRTEYDATLFDLLQDDTHSGFGKLPEDVNDPFDNDYTTQKVSQSLIESAETLASEAAQRAVAKPEVMAEIVPCEPSGASDTACLQDFIRTFGRRALRRPLTDAEIERYASLQEYAVEKDDFSIGVELVLTAMLQDVEFLYRIEVGEPVNGVPNVYRLNDFEVATRLSYFLWGTTPDDVLLDVAEQGGLSSPQAIQAVALEMMENPQARTRVNRFHALWLGYHQLPHPPELTGPMRAESDALIERIVFDEPGDYMDLFTSTETFIDQTLVDHYGLTSSEAGESWVSYGDSGRQGILSHGSVLSSFGKFADTSPTQRGIFVRTRLMCDTIDPPPPNVVADAPPEGDPDACKIEKYAQHTAGGCSGCHNQMDPIGFGLENYDKAGRYRATDDGNAACVIEGDGTITELGAFNGPGELQDMLIESGMLEECMVKQVYRFAVGRRERADDDAELERVTQAFLDEGRAFDALLMGIVASDAFGYRKLEEEE
jgi:hypothetical protein